MFVVEIASSKIPRNDKGLQALRNDKGLQALRNDKKGVLLSFFAFFT